MRGSVRVVLSSYIVVLAGCTPSVSPIPAPHFAPVTDEVRLSLARSGPADTLSVKVSGPASMRSIGSANFTATVGNGTARRYYYWWFMASCATKGGCAASSYAALDEGEGKSTVSVPFGARSAEKDLVVQVAEIDGPGRTGSSVEFVAMGPAQRLGGGSEGFTGGRVCDWYAGSFYPHTGTYTDPFSGRSWKRGFRRDYCGNRVSWQPEI